MKYRRTLCLPIFLCFIGTLVYGSGNAQAQAADPAPTVAGVVDREIGVYEKMLVEAAEAMPEDGFDFSPASLNINGGNYKDVRTFGQLIKHTAEHNFHFWTGVMGEKMPDKLKNLDELKSKKEIIQLLKDSFELGHRAAKTLTAENNLTLMPYRNAMAPRLFVATFAVIHAADEYGQMIEYLRMKGITPPASRASH